MTRFYCWYYKGKGQIIKKKDAEIRNNSLKWLWRAFCKFIYSGFHLDRQMIVWGLFQLFLVIMGMQIPHLDILGNFSFTLGIGSFQFGIVPHSVLATSIQLSFSRPESNQRDNVIHFKYLASLWTSFRLHLFLFSSSVDHLTDCEGISHLLMWNGAQSKIHLAQSKIHLHCKTCWLIVWKETLAHV